MFFRFGGLATLAATGDTRPVIPSSSGSAGSSATEGFFLTQVGVKFVVSERLMFPVYFGAALAYASAQFEEQSADRTDWGFVAGAGLEYHFRIWRRISPFFGFTVGMELIDPTGDSSRAIAADFGPALGVEYYIADRVSLAAQYQLSFVAGTAETKVTSTNPYLPPTTATIKGTVFTFQTRAGGALNLTLYF